jgi:hypothetical protein
LRQRLTEVNHPDHTLITYPNLGHLFYPSSQWENGIGPIQQYVLADIYSWLEAHSGLSDSYVTTSTASAMEANTKGGLNSMIISTNIHYNFFPKNILAIK